MEPISEIQIRGARVNNLRNVSCNLPHRKFIVMTGPSGSGKSSLAFDTLYAEGQRRYIESMSSYARQFLARIEKPDVDDIRHILPAIALEQKNTVKNARSTVGTATDIQDFLKLLFAHIGETRCEHCGGPVSRSDPGRIQQALRQLPEGSKVLLLAPVLLKDFSVEELLRQGFFRIFHQGEIRDLNTFEEPLSSHETVRIVIDRLIVKPKALGARLMESIRSALTLGDGKIEAWLADTGESHAFQSAFACLNCQQPAMEPFPNLFSFNSPLGACPTCEGFGRIMGLDLDKVIPNPLLSLSDGAIHPFTLPSCSELYEEMITEARKRKIPLNKPWRDLTDKQKAFILDGDRDAFKGVHGFFDWLESKKYKVHIRVLIAKYRGYYPCPDCGGSRLRKEAQQVYIEGRNMQILGETPISELLTFFDALTLPPAYERIAARLLQEIRTRLQYLQDIGLGYLTLSRQFRTLSNGEAQRINLSSALGSGLTDTLYVLDEPTVGLHARDTQRLIRILRRLREHGNTLVVVEHDPEVILAADHVVDMGPSGGEEGGRILYEGAPEGLLKAPGSLTAHYLRSHAEMADEARERHAQPAESAEGWIEIRGARGNNLKNLTVRLPMNQLVCVSGVSGSGKSTLIKQTLFAGYEHSRSRSLTLDAAPCDALIGLDAFKDVLLVDQTPPGRSIRSNPVTYVKAYDEIRKRFSETRKAMTLGITPGHFSFNTAGGRCETCEGLGFLTIDMQFMADVTMVCHDCQGRRFRPEVLSVEVDGKNIHEVLNLTLDEAIAFWASCPRIVRRLEPLREIGLGYLKLGQSTSTLSGGEAQRLKLAAYLPGSSEGVTREPCLFLFDEPTTGLHMADIARLLQAFRALIAAGHSVIVIEHNLDFIARTDYILDLGPEGGEGGGQLIAQGPVEAIIATPQSITGQFLRGPVRGRRLAPFGGGVCRIRLGWLGCQRTSPILSPEGG